MERRWLQRVVVVGMLAPIACAATSIVPGPDANAPDATGEPDARADVEGGATSDAATTTCVGDAGTSSCYALTCTTGVHTLQANRDRLIADLAKRKCTSSCTLWAALSQAERYISLMDTAYFGAPASLLYPPGSSNLETALDHALALYSINGPDAGQGVLLNGLGGNDYNRIYLGFDALAQCVMRNYTPANPTHQAGFNAWTKSDDLGGPHAPFTQRDMVPWFKALIDPQTQGPQFHFWQKDSDFTQSGLDQRLGVCGVTDPSVTELTIAFDTVHDSNPLGNYPSDGTSTGGYGSAESLDSVRGSRHPNWMYVPTSCPTTAPLNRRVRREAARSTGWVLSFRNGSACTNAGLDGGACPLRRERRRPNRHDAERGVLARGVALAAERAPLVRNSLVISLLRKSDRGADTRLDELFEPHALRQRADRVAGLPGSPSSSRGYARATKMTQPRACGSCGFASTATPADGPRCRGRSTRSSRASTSRHSSPTAASRGTSTSSAPSPSGSRHACSLPRAGRTTSSASPPSCFASEIFAGCARAAWSCSSASSCHRRRNARAPAESSPRRDARSRPPDRSASPRARAAPLNASRSPFRGLYDAVAALAASSGDGALFNAVCGGRVVQCRRAREDLQRQLRRARRRSQHDLSADANRTAARSPRPPRRRAARAEPRRDARHPRARSLGAAPGAFTRGTSCAARASSWSATSSTAPRTSATTTWTARARPFALHFSRALAAER